MMKNNRAVLAQCRRAVVAAALLLSTSVFAQGAIQSVTGSLQDGSEVLRIELSQPLSAPPAGFAIQSPARIALDFPGTQNATGQTQLELNQGNLRSVNVVEAGGRSRVVINLKAATSYKTDIQGNNLYVILAPVPTAATLQAVAEPRVFANRTAASDVQPIRDVDFRRGADSAGRIVVGLASNQVAVDLRQEGRVLVADFLRSSLPEGLRRRLDVTDFGTPVQTITTSEAGGRVRMRIEPTGEWEHSAYQSDNQFVIEVRQKKVDTTKLSQGPGFTGEKLSLNFQSIEVRSLLQVIADFTNFNIVTSDTVTGSLTLRLKDVPWDQALQIIMDAKGLGMRKSGSVLWIAPKDEIDARIKKDFEATLAIQKLEPLRTQGFQLNYAKATAMIAQIASNAGGGTGSTTRFLSERGSAIAEPRTNQLFVTDTASKLEEVKNLLATLDIPVRQVLIEARIVEARDTFGRSLGVKLGGGDLRAQNGGNGGYSIGGGNRIGFGTSYANSTATAGAGGTVDTSGTFVNLPASLSNVQSAGTFALSIFNSAANRFLTLELSAMEADGKGKVVSSPRLITADQTKALIEQGTEYPYSVTAPNGATTIAFKKAVLKLEVTPQITPEGNIILDLDVNKDSRGETTSQGVAIDTKHIQTQVLVENGGTVVIGGIFEMEETNNETKVPLLGDMPVVGNLFKSRTRETSKREMLVFITPKMLMQNPTAR
ncbi:type IV pilus secretin PilQ [Comamonas antarctica]|uniref:Type IV pilus biogenesis and competence protein PilQ n=2 Tax=Comamonas antarctica TaxID=2743470 RepID=A0A6N1X4L5_9BURK|nr:type IV pilus secretin PilQ [Comamonas antarctica]QKV54291.1 type IV pilus secretin PilQ [Comamonas antarctica]